MSETSRFVIGVASALAVALASCGDGRTDAPADARGTAQQASAADVIPWQAPSGWTVHTNDRRGYVISLAPGWHRAPRSLSPAITDPVEILSVATFSLSRVDGLCRALASTPPDGALVTIQERGRGAYGGPSFPPRPTRFRPNPKLPGTSEWPYCLAGDAGPPIPIDDYWFGFGDAGRAFHILVGIGRAAPPRTRRDAFRILDSLRLDPRAKPDWESSG